MDLFGEDQPFSHADLLQATTLSKPETGEALMLQLERVGLVAVNDREARIASVARSVAGA